MFYKNYKLMKNIFIKFQITIWKWKSLTSKNKKKKINTKIKIAILKVIHIHLTIIINKQVMIIVQDQIIKLTIIIIKKTLKDILITI
jgi:hypothetical protein